MGVLQRHIGSSRAKVRARISSLLYKAIPGTATTKTGCGVPLFYVYYCTTFNDTLHSDNDLSFRKYFNLHSNLGVWLGKV